MCLGNNLYNYLCVCLGNLALEEEGDNSGRDTIIRLCLGNLAIMCLCVCLVVCECLYVFG